MDARASLYETHWLDFPYRLTQSCLSIKKKWLIGCPPAYREPMDALDTASQASHSRCHWRNVSQACVSYWQALEIKFFALMVGCLINSFVIWFVGWLVRPVFFFIYPYMHKDTYVKQNVIINLRLEILKH